MNLNGGTRHAGRSQVLVIDDEPQILASISDLLEDDFAVSATTNAETALRQLEKNGVAVILSDQRMPGLAGDEFLRRASRISRATRILITGYTDWDALVRAVNNGQIYSYVPKPWDPVDLKSKVVRAAEHYHLQEALAKERDLLHALMDNMPDAIYFKDARLRFTRINHALADLLGISGAQEAVGKSDFDLFSKEYAEQSFADDQQIVNTRKPVKDKLERIHKPGGGAGWFSTTKVPILDARKRVAGIVGISRDITERQLAEELLARRAEELERLTYVSAHDLQEPLRTVGSFTQLLEHRYRNKLDPAADKLIDLIVSGARRTQQLIRDLLEYSRIGRGDADFQLTDCNTALAEALDNLHAAIEESRAAVTSDSLPSLPADARQIAQLFQNLIGNAIKFSGGQPPQVHVAAERSDEEWTISVRDNGVGIDSRYLDRIFAPFERLHGRDKFPGTGIGLAICKRIVERHGGRIWVVSRPGNGSVFHFTLPAGQPNPLRQVAGPPATF
jgi:PAS domain S-box-containing protein